MTKEILIKILFFIYFIFFVLIGATFAKKAKPFFRSEKKITKGNSFVQTNNNNLILSHSNRNRGKLINSKFFNTLFPPTQIIITKKAFIRRANDFVYILLLLFRLRWDFFELDMRNLLRIQAKFVGSFLFRSLFIFVGFELCKSSSISVTS